MSSELVETTEPRVRTRRRRPDVPTSRRAFPPPLESGDYLSRGEFHRRYEAHPEIKKAELIEEVVYVGSRVRIEAHSYPHANMVAWLGIYMASTLGVTAADSATVLLDLDNEVQPDAFLRLEQGGKSRITEDDYLEGAPELVVEIAASSVSYDLHIKKHVYQRNGVQEYLTVQVYDQKVDWFILRDGVYETLPPDENGVLRNEVFPGLWLQPETLWSDDLAAMLDTLQEGLASEEHGAFVDRLQRSEQV